jgi:hypothetical protein
MHEKSTSFASDVRAHEGSKSVVHLSNYVYGNQLWPLHWNEMGSVQHNVSGGWVKILVQGWFGRTDCPIKFGSQSFSD